MGGVGRAGLVGPGSGQPWWSCLAGRGCGGRPLPVCWPVPILPSLWAGSSQSGGQGGGTPAAPAQVHRRGAGLWLPDTPPRLTRWQPAAGANGGPWGAQCGDGRGSEGRPDLGGGEMNSGGVPWGACSAAPGQPALLLPDSSGPSLPGKRQRETPAPHGPCVSSAVPTARGWRPPVPGQDHGPAALAWSSVSSDSFSGLAEML